VRPALGSLDRHGEAATGTDETVKHVGRERGGPPRRASESLLVHTHDRPDPKIVRALSDE